MAARRRSTGRPPSTISPTTSPGLLDALGIAQAHVVGLSLGGMAGQAFALRYADRLDRLVLIATSAEMDKAAWRERVAIVKREGYGSFVDIIMVAALVHAGLRGGASRRGRRLPRTLPRP